MRKLFYKHYPAIPFILATAIVICSVATVIYPVIWPKDSPQDTENITIDKNEYIELLDKLSDMEIENSNLNISLTTEKIKVLSYEINEVACSINETAYKIALSDANFYKQYSSTLETQKLYLYKEIRDMTAIQPHAVYYVGTANFTLGDDIVPHPKAIKGWDCRQATLYSYQHFVYLNKGYDIGIMYGAGYIDGLWQAHVWLNVDGTAYNWGIATSEQELEKMYPNYLHKISYNQLIDYTRVVRGK